MRIAVPKGPSLVRHEGAAGPVHGDAHAPVVDRPIGARQKVFQARAPPPSSLAAKTSTPSYPWKGREGEPQLA